MALVCKRCGYKQYDQECIAVFKKLYPGYEEHDIPYYCGACQDNADDEEYAQMVEGMDGIANNK